MRASNVVGLYLHSEVDLTSTQDHRTEEPDMPLTRPLHTHTHTYNKAYSFAYLKDPPMLLVFAFHFTRTELWNSLMKSKMSPYSQFLLQTVSTCFWSYTRENQPSLKKGIPAL